MLYHKQVKWPKRIVSKLPFGVRKLVFSGHACRQMMTDKNGHFTLPRTVNMAEVEVFEVEEKNKNSQLDKVVFRVRISERFDAVVAAIPGKNGLFVKTTWLNARSDNHKTLQRERYAK